MITSKDIPKENLFVIGAVPRALGSPNEIIDGYHFARPRQPFIVSRAEALNIIGYMIAHGELRPKDIEAAVRACQGIDVPIDDNQIRIQTPHPTMFYLSPQDGLRMIGALIRGLGLKPAEIDAAAIAIQEQAQGQTRADIPKIMQ